jgi:hypothetical protein
MAEILSFRPRSDRPGHAATRRHRSPEVVFHDGGWRILQLPNAGRFLAVSNYYRRGIEVGRFDPKADRDNQHQGTEIAILTRCGSDERLARCAIAWLNSGGPRTAILGAFVIAAGGRYRYWRDAIVEVAVIGGRKLVRLSDGSIAIAREPEPVPLLDLFALLRENRHRAAFKRLPGELRAAILRWADPRDQFGNLSHLASPR